MKKRSSYFPSTACCVTWPESPGYLSGASKHLLNEILRLFELPRGHSTFLCTLQGSSRGKGRFPIRQKTPDGRPQGPTTPHPLPARPYYTTNRPSKPVYSRGRGGCGRGDGALVAARPYPPP